MNSVATLMTPHIAEGAARRTDGLIRSTVHPPQPDDANPNTAESTVKTKHRTFLAPATRAFIKPVRPPCRTFSGVWRHQRGGRVHS
jgi:hypothetical protein